MALEFKRGRGVGGDGGEEEGGTRRTKRPRVEEEAGNSEQELALLPSDEDLFSLPLASSGAAGGG